MSSSTVRGNTKANVTKTLTSISGVTAADIAPITAFELNLVGPVNGESARAVLWRGDDRLLGVEPIDGVER